MAVSSDVCPTEDAVQVFLQHLVDPFLTEKSSVRDNPSPAQHQLIAKQVHSVVLLYNYYHRKQHPELEYLPFNEFCKLIGVLRPPLLAYMQFMQKLNEVELIDVEKQLSLTEKVIMDACDICRCLDASKTAPNVQGWPISKVSILLIDSKKENCFLLFDSITSGVWSVVEKNVDTSHQNPEVESETKNTNKRKRVIRKSAKDEFKVDEDELLQVGYSAIKEATGINNTDIVLLESYTIYSQSKEKAASRFFIMQCSQSINQEVIKVPLKDVIESLKGPLVKKSSSSWTITPAVVYFHVLPYSEVISQCISRKEFSNSLQDSRVTEKNIMVNIPEVTESYIFKDIYSGIDSKPSEDNFETQEQNKEKRQKISNSIQFGEDQEKHNPSLLCNSNGSANAIQAMKVDSTRIVITEGGINNIASSGKLCANRPNISYVKDTTDACTKSSNHCNSNGSVNAIQARKVDSTRILITEGGINNIASSGKLCANRPNISYVKETTDACTKISNHCNSDREKPQSLQDSKKKLSRTAIASLIRKKNQLAIQQRKIEEEIAICDTKLQRLLTDGKDDFELMIECIVEGCNDALVTTQEGMDEQQ
ncbi:uncharacterized protein LOC123916860 isoform X1 [Trifolium pratense]|uniref:Uncharacterized protein n=1 Tax=Trifolium pratense TaxID=57577 RepID=A0ACB0MAX2_TRIPR|nr:uncharacterized protein LOC123916860 isoform X1 [Trifolium pratense]XP_045824384.1 uncharacterized protein LOC123916860 isoform X1 [Trifolium pratense]XP_045824385.1 uncharacterized protein LOC123916860 isoform X1 [Trifolium pratense]XP_045824386.1 uncharacterized protein LOC123916860 isoform X1 [Trifolium pratense]CAJ2679056.1 unnamed protein product [Trifolium pratense]